MADEEADKKFLEEGNDTWTKINAKTEELKGLMAHKAKGLADLPKFVVPRAKRKITSHTRKVYCATWDIDSTRIATAGQEGQVVVTEASKNIILKTPIASPFVMQCAIYQNSVVCGGMKNLIEYHDISDTKPVKKADLEGHEGYIAQLHFLEGGTKLLSGSGDGYAKIFDLNSKKCIQTFEGHAADVSGVAINGADSKVFATSSTDKTCRVWDMRQQYAVRKFVCKYPANCIAIMPEAKGIMAGQDRASYEFFDIGCNLQVARGKVKSGRCESIAISPSGRTCYSGWDTGVLLVADSYQPENCKECPPSAETHEGAICSLSVAPDGSALLSGSFDTFAKVWGAPDP